MKIKTFLVATVMTLLFTNNCYAYQIGGLNNKEYISRLNTNISEMRAELDSEFQKTTTIKSSLKNGLVYGIKDGYFMPNMKNDIRLQEDLLLLIDNMKGIKIENDTMKNKHLNLMARMEELTFLLDDTIEARKKVLEGNNTILGGWLEQECKIKKANKKIDEVNNIYKEINKTVKYD